MLVPWSPPLRNAHFRNANATIFDPGGDCSRPSPPAAMTTYCRPLRPMNVIGVACALASSVVSQQQRAGLRVERAEAAVDRRADEDRPPAVAIVPPMFGVPVLSKPRAFRSSNDAERHAPARSRRG